MFSYETEVDYMICSRPLSHCFLFRFLKYLSQSHIHRPLFSLLLPHFCRHFDEIATLVTMSWQQKSTWTPLQSDDLGDQRPYFASAQSSQRSSIAKHLHWDQDEGNYEMLDFGELVMCPSITA